MGSNPTSSATPHKGRTKRKKTKMLSNDAGLNAIYDDAEDRAKKGTLPMWERIMLTIPLLLGITFLSGMTCFMLFF